MDDLDLGWPLLPPCAPASSRSPLPVAVAKTQHNSSSVSAGSSAAGDAGKDDKIVIPTPADEEFIVGQAPAAVVGKIPCLISS